LTQTFFLVAQWSSSNPPKKQKPTEVTGEISPPLALSALKNLKQACAILKASLRYDIRILRIPSTRNLVLKKCAENIFAGEIECTELEVKMFPSKKKYFSPWRASARDAP